jgi:hypothetical protein
MRKNGPEESAEVQDEEARAAAFLRDLKVRLLLQFDATSTPKECVLLSSSNDTSFREHQYLCQWWCCVMAHSCAYSIFGQIGVRLGSCWQGKHEEMISVVDFDRSFCLYLTDQHLEFVFLRMLSHWTGPWTPCWI